MDPVTAGISLGLSLAGFFLRRLEARLDRQDKARFDAAAFHDASRRLADLSRQAREVTAKIVNDTSEGRDG